MQLNLTLGVDSLERSAEFYRNLLGLKVEEACSSGGKATALIVSCEEVRILLLPLAQLTAKHPVLLQNLGLYPRGAGVQIELTCTELESVARRLERGGVPIAYELEDRQFGRQEIWVQDPDGYLLVLNQENG